MALPTKAWHSWQRTSRGTSAFNLHHGTTHSGQGSTQGHPEILGVDSPFFSTIVLFKNRQFFSPGFWRGVLDRFGWGSEWTWKVPPRDMCGPVSL